MAGTVEPGTTQDLEAELDAPTPGREFWLNGRILVRMAIGALVLLAATLLLVTFIQGPARPTDNSAAAGFARDMIDHHAQAVDMAAIVQRRTQDDDMRYLTSDVSLTQTNQMGQMQGWLNIWGLTIGRSGPPMEWMKGHEAEHELAGLDPQDIPEQGSSLMPGMAAQADVNKLRTLPTEEADVLFLQLMIKHHRGGVSMAQAAIKLTDEPVVVNLARSVVKAQQSEIDLMKSMLAERGAQATP